MEAGNEKVTRPTYVMLFHSHKKRTVARRHLFYPKNGSTPHLRLITDHKGFTTGYYRHVGKTMITAGLTSIAIWDGYQ